MNVINFINETLKELNIEQIKIAEVTGYTRQSISKMLKSEKLHKYQEMALICGLDKLIIKQPHNWGGSVDLDTYSEDQLVPCTMPWHAQVILWDGRVGCCPHDFFAKIILGDVKENKLSDIFNSIETQELRRRHLDHKISDFSPCNECDTPRRHSILGIPTSSLKYVKE